MQGVITHEAPIIPSGAASELLRGIPGGVNSMNLSKAIAQFLEYRSVGFAVNTLKGDRQALDKLIAYTGDVPLTSITPTTIDQFFATLQPKLSTGSLRLTMDKLRYFFGWCRDRGLTPYHHAPMANRRPIPREDLPKIVIGIEQFPELLDAASSPRDRFAIATCLFTLLRQSEVVDLKVADLDLQAGRLSARIFKSHKTDKMPISPDYRQFIVEWLEHYQQTCGPLQPEWYLIPAQKPDGFQTFTLNPSRPITRTNDIVHRVLDKLGITEGRRGMHVLRRSAAQAILAERVNQGYSGAMREVQSLLHHASITTTEVYLNIDEARSARDEHYQDNPMYPSLAATNVVRMRGEDGHNDDQALRLVQNG